MAKALFFLAFAFIVLTSVKSLLSDTFEDDEIFDVYYEKDADKIDDGATYEIVKKKQKRSLLNSFKLLRSHFKTNEDEETEDEELSVSQRKHIGIKNLYLARKIANLFELLNASTVRSRPNFFIG